jgi:pimeloyl-ACP methyl ester carboxylesterase
VAAALALALAGCTSSPPSPAGTASPPVSPSTATGSGSTTDLARFYDQSIGWSGCGGSFECGTLNVPLDYAATDADSLQLALIRLPATDPDRRIGSLILNPGGPGGSGVGYVRAARAIIDPSVREVYDIVGFDPRGVAGSDPVECVDDQQTDDLLSEDGTPDDPAEVAALANLGQAFATGCATRSAALYPHIGTVDVARDVDVLRGALGDETLNWFGSSYGTFIGATYADLFPTRVGRMVLDGAIDPTLTNASLARGQAGGFELALRRFVADCDAVDSCPLPAGVEPGMARIRQFFADLDAAPITNTGGRPLTQALAMNAVLYLLYFPPTDWAELRAGLRAAFGGDGSVLLNQLDARLSRSKDGHYQDNSIDALVAVNALDHTDRPGPDQIAALGAKWAKALPTWGEFFAWANLPYHYWQAPPTLQPHRVSAPGSPPILVVGTTYDPATPYPWAKSLARQLSQGVLLTRVGDGHTGYGMGSTCTDQAVDTFLVDGTPPPDGTVCR